MTTNMKFAKMLEPGMIGKVKTRNRIFKTGAGTTLGDATGRVNDRHRAFYGSLARGGVGLIVLESCNFIRPEVQDVSSGGNTFLRFDDDSYISSLKELTDLIHKYDFPVFSADSAWWFPLSRHPGIRPTSSSELTRQNSNYANRITRHI